jgi:AcrR family transcriptional regulator
VPRQPFTQAETEATRSKLRDAALGLFEREGYAATTMRSIAREAGCSAAAPYLYFESKEHLLTAIRAEGFRGLAEALEAAVDRTPDLVEQLRGVLRGYIQFGVDRPEVYRLMFSLRQGGSARHPLVRTPRERSFGVARQLCRRMIDAALMTGDANVHAHLLWLNCHGLVSLHLADQLDLGADFEALVEPLVEHWAGQLSAPKRPARQPARRSTRRKQMIAGERNDRRTRRRTT